jgi:hypothetical protein
MSDTNTDTLVRLHHLQEILQDPPASAEEMRVKVGNVRTRTPRQAIEQTFDLMYPDNRKEMLTMMISVTGPMSYSGKVGGDAWSLAERMRLYAIENGITDLTKLKTGDIRKHLVRMKKRWVGAAPGRVARLLHGKDITP